MRIPKHATHEYRLCPYDKCEVQVKVNAAEMQWRHYSWHWNEALARVEMKRLIALRDGKEVQEKWVTPSCAEMPRKC